MADLVVDIHAHYVPNLIFDRFHAHHAAFPGVRMIEETTGGRRSFRFQFPGGEMTRPVTPALSELANRALDMTQEGVDHAILSLWTDLEGYELAPEEGQAWSEFVNACFLEELRDQPRFSFLASVPLQDGQRAARVLEDAMAQGFSGAMIGTLPHGAAGGMLDDPSLDAFWEAASRLGAAIYVHPMFLCNEPRLAGHDLVNAVGRVVDTSIAIARLFYSGHPSKYPGMKLVLSHGGGALPYTLGRFIRCYQASPGQYADPQSGFDALYFDSCVYDAQTLEFLVGRAGAARVMLGTDAPMSIAETHPVRLVANARLIEADKNAILGDNAKRVFRLRADCACRAPANSFVAKD